MSDALELHEVDKIIRKRVKNGRDEYLVKWVGFAATWEPAENLDFVESAPNPANDESTEFDVEKVLNKREKKGQVQYLIKWVGYNKPSWEPVENLSCEELVEDYEISRAVRVLAANQNICGENGLFFLMQWNEKGLPTSPVNLAEARNLWPQLLIDYFEQNMNWFSPIKTVTFIEEPIEADEVDSNPITIHYATFVTRRLMYWVEFSDEKFKFVENTEMAIEFPQLVIDFLVTKAEIFRDIDFDSYMLTRSMYKDLLTKNFLVCTKVQIARVSALDAILIKKPRQRFPVRRYTFDGSNEKDFRTGILETSTDPESIVAPSAISALNGNAVSAEPVASKAATPDANSCKVSGLKVLKVKSILKKPRNNLIGARGRRKSTHGRMESTCADNPLWNQEVLADAVEKMDPNETIEQINAVSIDAVETALLDTSDQVETIESTETAATIEPAKLADLAEAVTTKSPSNGLNDEE